MVVSLKDITEDNILKSDDLIYILNRVSEIRRIEDCEEAFLSFREEKEKGDAKSTYEAFMKLYNRITLKFICNLWDSFKRPAIDLRQGLHARFNNSSGTCFIDLMNNNVYCIPNWVTSEDDYIKDLMCIANILKLNAYDLMRIYISASLE